MEDKIREHIYLAALLHDIGKFYQRADNPYSDKRNDLSEPVKNMADLICPLDNEGRFGYQHTVWTLQFLTEIEAILKKTRMILPAVRTICLCTLLRVQAVIPKLRHITINTP